MAHTLQLCRIPFSVRSLILFRSLYKISACHFQKWVEFCLGSAHAFDPRTPSPVLPELVGQRHFTDSGQFAPYASVRDSTIP